MSNYVTVRGFIGTEVNSLVTGTGLPITKFRVGSTHRYHDRKLNTWVDAETNWYSVSLFRQLATNAGASLNKGDAVIVTGKLRIRPWVNEDGKSGTTVEIEADSVGHDLSYGTASFRRSSADKNDAGTQHRAEDLPNGVDGLTGEITASEEFLETAPLDDGPTEDGEAPDGRSEREAKAQSASAHGNTPVPF